jgi:hypothetical protein
MDAEQRNKRDRQLKYTTLPENSRTKRKSVGRRPPRRKLVISAIDRVVRNPSDQPALRGNPETGLGKSDVAFKQFKTTRRVA